MATTSRSLQHTWSEAWTTAPPAPCSTLRNSNNVVKWGHTCAFSEEEDEEDGGGSAQLPVNTACMPWVTSGANIATNAFYSPATACPAAWTAVATATSGSDQWIDGETAITCCPNGFEGDNSGGCRPASNGVFPVVECGEADAEENESRRYSGAAWPASATASVTALQLRYQPSDVGSTATSGATASGASSSNEATNDANSDGDGGLSTGAKAAIGVVIPVVFILGAIAFFLLWRRRKAKKGALAEKSENDAVNGKPGDVEVAHNTLPKHNSTTVANPMIAAHRASGPTGTANETPEWNVEMDARETERYRPYRPPPPEDASVLKNEANVSELGGLGRRPRKPVAAYEIDGTERRPELEGDGGNIEGPSANASAR